LYRGKIGVCSEVQYQVWWGDMRKEIIWKTWAWIGGNINMDIQEVGWRALGLVDLAEDRNRWRAIVDTMVNLGVP
jgi:hypothetical protein